MNLLKTVAFYTLGCKLNFSETSTIARNFVENDFEKVPFDKPADVYVINTCSVTENADNKFKSVVKIANKNNPDAFIIAIGCYAQLKPNELASVLGVNLVLGANEKFNILNYIDKISINNSPLIYSCNIDDVDNYISSYSISDRTRAFLKVQDGCDYKCTYCTIPLARGISRSDDIKSIINNAEVISKTGIKEIVLTGVNIGDYGKGEFGNKKHESTFLDLIESLDKTSSIDRIRISSIEPNLLKNNIISFVSKSNLFVPHFHIPLQSGSNEILKLMKRRYLRDLYVDRVKYIKNLIPDACIGVDVIVGFPGETEEYFIDTFNFLNSLDVSYLHVFSYSERDNTLASKLADIVPKAVRTQRSKILRSLSIKKRRLFYESQLGKSKNVLYESENKKGYIYGFTENYVKIRTPWNPKLINTIQQVDLDFIDDRGFVRVKSKTLELA
ncbi:tRNA (N(6)-L-threonylcarbamoyladenosine(37)-C(2))-methylthiotransferase MtaB [Flavobacteriaceae bacterium]|nr:tRNA (N(6)-L-threonylcarbamoyladenosine(37)-C(2))-methylthiotransferase MtaB [Flavobacteriaceae bacterium]